MLFLGNLTFLELLLPLFLLLLFVGLIVSLIRCLWRLGSKH